jgi:hypothetical protein
MKMTDAELAFATANTPLYLLRKLRSSMSVKKIAAVKTSFQIYRSLSAALKRKPDTFRESVLPFVLLVSLSIKFDGRKYLVESAGLPSPYHPWFRYCCDNLVMGAKSATTESIKFKGNVKIERFVKRGVTTNVVRFASGT